jgi:ubiquinone/menaquinone biosynthesis C-methylase UbiE
MKKQAEFFDFAAEVGLTKHMGGLHATEELISICHISRDTSVLDVGCGVGLTPVFLAKKVGCRVTGIDIHKGMIQRSRERAKKEGVSDLTEFRVADAQELPFEDNTFDVVITESVTAFPADKQKAVNEYARVISPGGFVGMNESTWLKVPPPPELVTWASRDLGANASPLTSGEWSGLLEAAGLKDLVIKSSGINMKEETRGVMDRYGKGGMLRVMFRMIALFSKSPEYRKFIRTIKKEGIAPACLKEYFGYGLYVGRK